MAGWRASFADRSEATTGVKARTGQGSRGEQVCH